MSVGATSGSSAGDAGTSPRSQPRSVAELLDLDALIASAASDPTIAAAAADAGLRYDVMQRHARSQHEEIDRIVASERYRMSEDVDALNAVGEWKWSLRREDTLEVVANWAALVAFAALVVVIAGYLVLRFGFSIAVSWWAAGGAGVGAALLAGGSLLLARRLDSRAYRMRERERAEHDEVRAPAEQRVQVSADILSTAAIEKAIRPRLREFINARLANRYGTLLTVDEAPGLAELEDPQFEIPTVAAERLRRLFQTMPGGSIGIAGPRGAGKTTLIRSFCSDREPTPAGQPKLGVLVSAPVDYEARDFVLHLFAAFCRALGGSSAEYDDPRVQSHRRDAALVAGWLVRYGHLIIPLLAGLGVWLVLGGTIPRLSALTPNAQVLSGILLLASATLFLIWRRVPWSQNTALREEQEFLKQYERERRSAADPLVQSADEWLRRIKFQQSYASGWSGSLKLPLGFQGGVTATSTMAQMQLSFPEIVDSFRDLARRAAAHNQVVIGIDELDKIESREDAQSFLNDIKAVFGIERCFYLISVSEDAMAHFERRGLPFRDAFDSALDEVVNVTFLDLNGSERLLKRRVVGMTVPFMALCHVLAGGLARDVIRYARSIIETRNDRSRATIGAVTTLVVRRELEAKFHALTIEGGEPSAPDERADFLAWISRFASQPITAGRLLDECRLASATPRSSLTRNGARPEAVGAASRLADLRRETTCFLYFAGTLLEFFSRDLNAARMQHAESRGRRPGGIDQLALARQRFSLDPGLAWQLITSFRKHHGLATVRIPPARTATSAPTTAAADLIAERVAAERQ
jgi:hypothetical protein